MDLAFISTQTNTCTRIIYTRLYSTLCWSLWQDVCFNACIICLLHNHSVCVRLFCLVRSINVTLKLIELKKSLRSCRSSSVMFKIKSVRLHTSLISASFYWLLEVCWRALQLQLFWYNEDISCLLAVCVWIQTRAKNWGAPTALAHILRVCALRTNTQKMCFVVQNLPNYI